MDSNSTKPGLSLRFRCDSSSSSGHLEDRVEISVIGAPEATKLGTALQECLTVDDVVKALAFGRFHWILVIICGLIWWSIGIAALTITILGPQIQCDWNLTAWNVAIINAIMFVGEAVGASFWGIIADKYGRKTCLLMSMAFSFYFMVLLSFAPKYIWFLFLMFMLGFTVAGAVQVSTLCSEFIISNLRANCLLFIALCWPCGSICMIGMASWMLTFMSWQWFMFICSIPLFIVTVICFWLPESARYYLFRGRPDNTLAIFQRIARFNGTTLPVGTFMARTEQVELGKIQDLFVSQQRRTTLILGFAWFVELFSYYGIVLLTTEMMGMDSSCGASDGTDTTSANCIQPCQTLKPTDYFTMMWTSVAELPGILVATWAADVLGRKPTTICTLLLFCVSLLCLMACVNRTATTVLLFIARAMISGSFQILYVYTTEVFPTMTRAIAVGMCSSCGRVGIISTPFVAQVLIHMFSIYTFVLYASLSFLCCISLLLLPLETKGRILMDGLNDDLAVQKPEDVPKINVNARWWPFGFHDLLLCMVVFQVVHGSGFI
uniref:SV2 related protein n=1 Tax=Eptatretus burgeri TaxID=7764 RepID=A0A8C4R5F9_EPTBU